MINKKINLEVFDAAAEQDGHILTTASKVEIGQIAAYERGYAAGWDDCIESKGNEAESLRLEVLRKIEHLTSYHKDIEREYLYSLFNIFCEVIGKYQLEIACVSMRKMVLDYTQGRSAELGTAELCVTVHPDLSGFIDGLGLTGVTVIKNDACGMGEIDISYPSGGVSANFEGLLNILLAEVNTLQGHEEVV